MAHVCSSWRQAVQAMPALHGMEVVELPCSQAGQYGSMQQDDAG